jgi:hypothetical protein
MDRTNAIGLFYASSALAGVVGGILAYPLFLIFCMGRGEGKGRKKDT